MFEARNVNAKADPQRMQLLGGECSSEVQSFRKGQVERAKVI